MKITDIIKYEGGNDIFIWKHPATDFNTMSQLIVHETQEAILFRNGQALDSFGAGRHTLKTENIPFLSKLINIPTGGESPFHCEVYFINKITSMNILWGTANKMLLKDPQYDITIPVGASGQMAVKVENGRKLLLELVGTIREFNQSTLTDYFRGILMTRIKELISNKLLKDKIGILEIYSHIGDISSEILEQLTPEFEKYGLKLVNFFVNNIMMPENDPSYITLKNALAEKTRYGILGTNYQQDRTFNILETAAGNEGSSNSVMGAGIGLGMGVNMGNMMGGNMGQAISNTGNIPMTPTSEKKKCSKCNSDIPENSKFCTECGEKVVDSNKIICPTCKLDTPKGKFCIECGHKFMTHCPKCNCELKDGAKFCMECGEKLI